MIISLRYTQRPPHSRQIRACAADPHLLLPWPSRPVLRPHRDFSGCDGGWMQDWRAIGRGRTWCCKLHSSLGECSQALHVQSSGALKITYTFERWKIYVLWSRPHAHAPSHAVGKGRSEVLQFLNKTMSNKQSNCWYVISSNTVNAVYHFSRWKVFSAT